MFRHLLRNRLLLLDDWIAVLMFDCLSQSLENKLHLKVDELESQKDRNEKVLSEMETLKTTINDLRDNQNKIQDVNEKDTALLYKRLQDLDSLALTRNQEIDKLHAALDKEKCVVQEKQDTIQDLKDKV